MVEGAEPRSRSNRERGGVVTSPYSHLLRGYRLALSFCPPGNAQQRLIRPARSALHWPNPVQRPAASGQNSGPAMLRSGEKQPPHPQVCNESPQSTSATPTICPSQSALENSFCVG